VSNQSSLWCKRALFLVSDLGTHSSRVKINDTPTVSVDNIFSCCFFCSSIRNFSFRKNEMRCFMAEIYLSHILHSCKATDHTVMCHFSVI